MQPYKSYSETVFQAFISIYKTKYILSNKLCVNKHSLGRTSQQIIPHLFFQDVIMSRLATTFNQINTDVKFSYTNRKQN